MMLTVKVGKEKQDIIIKPDQQVQEVCRCLFENGCFSLTWKEEMQVYSMRQKAYINPALTFMQGSIYNGDNLLLYM